MKKQILNLLVLVCFVALIATLQSCLKEADLPVVKTTEVSNIKTQSALFSGNITDNGQAVIELCGFCWGTADNPTVNDFKKYSKSGENIGGFNSTIFDLIPNTYYHVRAFAYNRVGIAYGNEVHFRTKQIITPKVTTSADTLSAQFTSIAVRGNITIYDETLILERGFCFSTKANPTTANIMFSCGTGSGNFGKILDQLQPGTLYYMKAYAVTIAGITYGNEVQFNTCVLPELKVLEITGTTARVEGKLKYVGYGNTEFYDIIGICYGTTATPTIAGHSIELDVIDNEWTLSCTLTNLAPGKAYYVRTYVMTLNWYSDTYRFVAYGNEITFSTSN